MRKLNAAPHHSLIDRPDFSITNPEYLSVGNSVYVGPNVVVSTPRQTGITGTGMRFEDGVFIGRNVEFGLPPGNFLSIGKETSIGPHSFIGGNVQIGNYCLIAAHTFIGTLSHNSKVKPTWLIRDQDALAVPQKKTVIGDDVWIGWGVYIQPGVTIGKGAVISPNTVVFKDVAPYTIQAGNPAREFDKRINFEPLLELNWNDENAYPYFYEGFTLKREEILKEKAIPASHLSKVVLPGGALKAVKISGVCELSSGVIKISLNGVPVDECPVQKKSFDLKVEVSNPQNILEAKKNLPVILQTYNCLEIEQMGTGKTGISKILVELCNN